jgi:hypothetical protein
VAAAKIYFKAQAQVAGTKQSRKAEKAVEHARFVLCLIFALALPIDF